MPTADKIDFVESIEKNRNAYPTWDTKTSFDSGKAHDADVVRSGHVTVGRCVAALKVVANPP